MKRPEISQEAIEKEYSKLKKHAEAGGYNLNPDIEFTKGLVEGLLVNQARFGYPACPCRLASSNRDEDRDIICPCDYRDPDLDEYSACYCALYVSNSVIEGASELQSIPERRPSKKQRQERLVPNPSGLSSLAYPVWRCAVCGYLCARDKPPEVCPVCKADRERFERFA